MYRGVHKETQEHVAVKVLKRGRVNMTAVNKEIGVYSRLARAPSNRGLNRLKEVYKDRSSRDIYLILDLMLGGDLYDRVPLPTHSAHTGSYRHRADLFAHPKLCVSLA